jgi:ABC-type Zn uptake system ZnuABC Zn-binding protein ZnuA
MKTFLLCILFFMTQTLSHANIKVVTTLQDLADIAGRIGGDRVSVSYLARGDQNPHFIEVKPSYMMKVRSADILFMVGMELELWAQQIIDGSRNASLDVVDLSQGIDKLEVPTRLDASQGDVHRYGNPHYWLDPRNIRVIADEMVSAFTTVSPSDGDYFRSNEAAFLSQLDAKIQHWDEVMKPFAGSRIITFHKSWSYFAKWLDLNVVDQIEPKPGIQPTPSHTADLIQLVRKGNIKAIVVEPFYDTSAAERIVAETGARIIRLTTSVGGVDQARDYISMMDYNINTLAGALQ